ncbi:MAG: outer membrane protein assembly factor BamA [Alphaproteobacteria bacterium]
MKKSVAILVASTTLAFNANALEVKDIVVNGLGRVEKETVLSYLNINKGSDVSAEDLDGALKNLYATSMFADVNIEMDNQGVVSVNLVENPIVSNVAFEGNDKIDDEMLKAELSINARSIYSKAKVQEDVNRMLELYRRSGRYKTTVTPKLIRDEDNRVELVYEIFEGNVANIESLNFIGNRKYSTGDLSSVVMSKESRWWRILSSSETYDADKTNYDKELLRRFYAKRGYADFRVVSAIAELSPDKNSFVLTYSLDEGERYKITNIDIVSQLEDVDVKSLFEDVTFEVGDWYNEDKIEKTSLKITESLGKGGFAFVNVSPEMVKNTQTGELEIVFNIREGQRVVVNQINITGNSRTDDEVIRRQFRVAEGDAFNTVKLKESRKNIEGLNYFSKVDMQTEPVEGTNKANVNVDLQEKSTGYFNVGVGFSTIDGLMLNGGITENNFRGKGQQVSLNATTSDRTNSYSLSFTEPYFLNRNLSAGIDLFNSSYSYEDEASYDTDTMGIGLRFGWRYTDELSQAFRYTYRENKIDNVDDSASLYIKDEEGKSTASVIGQTLAIDKLDSRINPKEGFYSSIGTDVAGAGGDEKYYKIDVKNYKYWTFMDDYTLKSWLNAGYIASYGDETISLFNRYNMGGKTMRGFAVAGIGARAVTDQDALGGNWMLYTGSELSFPIGLDEMGIKGKTFVDIGMLGKPDGLKETAGYEYEYSDAPRVSVGFGFGWASPMGQIDIDFGFPIVKEDYDETEVFRINFGTSL